jgi:hypothetical protein
MDGAAQDDIKARLALSSEKYYCPAAKYHCRQ